MNLLNPECPRMGQGRPMGEVKGDLHFVRNQLCPKADPSWFRPFHPHDQDCFLSNWLSHAPSFSSLTSLFMYPSLLMSYKLNVHLSFSWTVPLSRIDRAVTKSWEVEEAWDIKQQATGWGDALSLGQTPWLSLQNDIFQVLWLLKDVAKLSKVRHPPSTAYLAHTGAGASGERREISVCWHWLSPYPMATITIQVVASSGG